MKKAMLSVSLLLALASEAQAVCFVDAKASGADNGTTWSNAYVDLQSALTVSGCTEVWVAKGVYMPTTGTDTTASFVVNPAVALYGGFNGTEGSRNDRNPSLNVTVLSGDIGKDDLDATYDNIDFDASYIVGSNSNHVLEIDGSKGMPVTSDTVIDGFTITGGDSPDNGGGFACNGSGSGSECSPSLNNLVFTGNRAADSGGAVFIDLSSDGTGDPVITASRFNGNTAAKGGSVAVDASSGMPSKLDVSYATFVLSQADERGGAIYIDSSSNGDIEATLTDATFEENTSHDGGAIYLFADGDDESLLKLVNTQFRFNHSGHRAGAVYIDASFGLDAALSISASEFESNNAINSGGAIYAGSNDGGDLQLIVSGTTFDANNAYYGGAIEVSTSGTQLLSLITNSTFSDNGALYFGGAIDLDSSSEAVASVNLFNNLTFYGNHVDGDGAFEGKGGAIYAYDAPVSSDFLNVENSLLWDNSATKKTNGPDIYNELANEGSAHIALKYSIAENGCPADVDCTKVSGADPLLGPLAMSSGPTPVMIPGSGGSAIDAGDDVSCMLTDQRGIARPQGAHCDIGAVELASDRIFADGFGN